MSMALALALGLPFGGSTPSGPATYEGLVATRGLISNGTAADFGGGASFPNVMCSHGLVATDNLTSIKVAFSNCFIAFGNPGAGSGTTTISDVAIEYPIGAAKQRVLSAGANGFTMASGDVVFTDYLTLATQIPSGSTFRVWFYISTTTGNWVYRSVNATSDDGALAGSAGSPAANTVMTQGSAVPTKNLGGGAFIPVLGVIAQTLTKSVIVVGDSVAWAANFDLPANDGRLGLVCRGFASTLAFLNLSSSGQTSANFLASIGNLNKIFPFCSTMVNELGINDIAGGAAPLITTQTAIAAAFPARVKKLLTTLGPLNAGSTDGYTTLVNQTASGSQSITNSYNASVRAKTVSGYTDYFETSDVLESARDSGIWTISPSAPTPRTVTDGSIVVNQGVVTSATANFTSADLGFNVRLVGAGTAGGNTSAYILTVTDSSHVTLSGTASTGVASGMTVNIDGYTFDGLHPGPAMFAKVAASGAIDASKLA